MSLSDLEFQLFSAVDDSDVDALACQLELANSNGRKPTADLLASLLTEAIRRSDPASVFLLLDEYGAKAEPVHLDKMAYPFVEAIRAMELAYSFTGGRPKSNFQKSKNIVEKILAKGFTSFQRRFDDENQSSLLGSLFALAALMPKASMQLVTSLPPSLLRCNQDSALTAIFRRFARYGGSEMNVEITRNIFVNAVLPLLKSGCRFQPEIYSAVSPSIFEEIVRLDNKASFAVWQKPNVISSIVVEARQSNSLPAIDSFYIFDKTDAIGRQCQSSFMDYLHSVFPRRLEYLARCSILKNLPGGFHQRRKAIEALSLPHRLSSFLQFDEFDIISC